MTESCVFNIGEICRGCLSDNRDNLRSIFDSNIRDSFISCTSVQVTKHFVYKQSEPKFSIFNLSIKVTENDGLPKLICSSCVYKVISWVTFKTQCEQNDEILRTTFQCSERKSTASLSSNVSSGLELPQTTVDHRVNLNNLFESKNDSTDDTSASRLEQSPEQCPGNWNPSEPEIEAQNNESSVVYDKQDDEADEVEVVSKRILTKCLTQCQCLGIFRQCW